MTKDPLTHKQTALAVSSSLAHRSRVLKRSQSVTTSELGYHNTNFISTVGYSCSSVLTEYLVDFVRAYQMSPLAGISLNDELHPVTVKNLLAPAADLTLGLSE